MTCLTYDRLWAIEKPLDYRQRGKPRVARRTVLPALLVALVLASPVISLTEQTEGGCNAGSPDIGGTDLPPVFGKVYARGIIPLLRGVPFILILFWSFRIARSLRNPQGQFGVPEREAARALVMVCACFLLSQLAFVGSVINYLSFNGPTVYNKKMASICLLLIVSVVCSF